MLIFDGKNLRNFSFFVSLASFSSLDTEPKQSPSNATSGFDTSGGHQQHQQQPPASPSSFILRKKFNYKTKYNLTSLIRDLETGMREACKTSELSINYFSFTSDSAESAATSKSKSADTDNVFAEPSKTSAEIKITGDNKSKCGELKSCIRLTPTAISGQRDLNNYDTLMDDNEFGSDFKNLRATSFFNLQHNLNKSDNLVITLNAEYVSNTGLLQQQQQVQQNIILATPAATRSSSLSASMSSTTNTLAAAAMAGLGSPHAAYTRISSFGSGSGAAAPTIANSTVLSNSSSSTAIAAATNLNASTTNLNSLMMKSVSSNSGELESSSSLSNSLAFTALQLKRTFMFALACARTRTITFYCFTTESSCYDQIKQLLDQLCETLLQRYHLANNAVLYKLGGLIGDSLIYDLKKVKTLTISASQKETSIYELANSNDQRTEQSHKIALGKTFSANSPMTAQPGGSNMLNKNLSSSPKFQRQLSYKGPGPAEPSINPSLITNLQFMGMPPNSPGQLSAQQQQQQQQQTSPATLVFKQLFMSQSSFKSYDTIINLVNQQVHFCAQYLSHSAAPIALNDLSSSPSMLSNSFSNFTNINRQVTGGSNNASNTTAATKLNAHNLYSSSMNVSTLYGIGLNYQLFELQQIYRHPRKIYEIAVSMAAQASQPNQAAQTAYAMTNAKPIAGKLRPDSTQPLMNENGLPQAGCMPKFQFTVNDFYKNYILPVLIPFHYCCSPILFCTNWSNNIVTESMLGIASTSNLTKADSENFFVATL